jgi:hypothetical protein
MLIDKRLVIVIELNKEENNSIKNRRKRKEYKLEMNK